MRGAATRAGDDHRAGSDMTGGPQLEVHDVDPSTDPRWDAYVEAHPDAVVYHRSAWLRTLQREYPRPAVNLVVADSAGAVHGLMPLTITRGLPFGRGGELAGPRLSSLPRTPLAGPLADDRAGLELLVSAARWRLPAGTRLQLKPADERLAALVPPPTDHAWRMNYVLDLPEDPSALQFGRRANHVRIRSSIKAAATDGSPSAARGISATSAGGIASTSRRCANMSFPPGRCGSSPRSGRS